MTKRKTHISSRDSDKKAVKRTTVKEPGTEGDDSLEDNVYLIKYIKDCRDEARNATKDIRTRQKELWTLYQNKEDWSKKKSWQSTIFIPKLFMAVTRASSLIKRAILQTSKLFKMELEDDVTTPINIEIRGLKRELKKLSKQNAASINPSEGEKKEAKKEQETLRNAIESLEEKLDILKEELADDEKRFKKELSKSNFATTYGEGTIVGLLLGFGCVKRLFNAGKKKLRYENVNVLNLYICPDYKPSEDENPDYLIEYKEMTLAKLRTMAKKANDASKDGDVFDMDEIEKIKPEGAVKNRDEQDERQSKGLNQYTSVSKKVGILEFWGNVISKDGKGIKENQLMMLVNESHLIRKQDNPFDDKKYPYQFIIPLVYPHRGISGTSLVGAEVRLQYTLNNILNMIIDNLNFIVNKSFVYSPTALLKPSEVMSIYPGKMIPTNTPNLENVIKEVGTRNLGADVFKTYDIVRTEMQESDAVTEYLSGMPGKTKTLGEVEIKTAESKGFFDVIARELEINSIKPLLKGSYDLLVQFSNFKGDYIFKVGGLSLLLLRKDQIQTILQALNVALKNQTIGEITEIDGLWQRLLSIWNLSDVYKEREELPLDPSIVPGSPGGGETPEQMEIRAAVEAKRIVSQIPPQELMRA